jgi:RNA polymerase sigma-70 factor (family 1)
MHFNEKADHELTSLCRAGNHDAFTEIYHRHFSMLFRIASRIVEDESAAKDVIQDVFISFFENASKREILNLQAYLLQSVKYKCFMHLRSGKISEKHLQRMQHIIVSNVVEEAFNAAELQEVLDKGMAVLPEKCREVFYLSRFESLPNKQIASLLNISHKTVENQITKALKLLRLSVDKLAVLFICYFI